MAFKSDRPNLSVTHKYRETHGFKGKWTGPVLKKNANLALSKQAKY